MLNFYKKHTLKSQLKKNERRHTFLNMDAIRTVLVLFETSDYDIVDSFVERLQEYGKSVAGYAFRVKDDTFDYSETNYIIIGKKENIESFGAPSEELLKQLKSKYYDVVIDLTLKENFSLEFILANANTTMTVGLKKNKLPLYDLSISKPSQAKASKNFRVNELIKSITYYLKTIKGKDTPI